MTIYAPATAGETANDQIAALGFPLLIVGALCVAGILSPAVQAVALGTQVLMLADQLWRSTAIGFATASLPWPPVPAVIVAISVLLLGPGGYSVDAYLFGFREITIPPSVRVPSSSRSSFAPDSSPRPK
jgi:hypothetical protein